MSFAPRKILVATDFSANAREAADAAVELGRIFGAELTLIHVIPLSTYVDFASSVDVPTFTTNDFQAAVRARVTRDARDELTRLEGLGVTPRFVTVDGPPAGQLVSAARDGGFELIVVGTHGRTGLSHLLLGSVAESVVRHATTPVLTIRPRAKP